MDCLCALRGQHKEDFPPTLHHACDIHSRHLLTSFTSIPTSYLLRRAIAVSTRTASRRTALAGHAWTSLTSPTFFATLSRSNTSCSPILCLSSSIPNASTCKCGWGGADQTLTLPPLPTVPLIYARRSLSVLESRKRAPEESMFA